MERNGNNRDSSFLGKTNQTEMTSTLLKKILPALDNKMPIVLTSGEPTLAKELPKLVKILKENNFKDIALQTNGRRLTHIDYCIELIKAGVTSFSISIHGSRDKIHDVLTRTPGSFAQSFSGIENLIKIKRLIPSLKIFTTTTVNKINISDIQNILKMFIADRPLINTVVLNPVSLRGNALIHSRHLAISYTDIFKCVEKALNSLGLTKTERITITDMPKCVNDFYSGPSEDISLIDIELKHKHLKVKAGENSAFRKECQTCIYYHQCPGVSEEYIRIFGWNEFIPVINQNNRDKNQI